MVPSKTTARVGWSTSMDLESSFGAIKGLKTMTSRSSKQAMILQQLMDIVVYKGSTKFTTHSKHKAHLGVLYSRGDFKPSQGGRSEIPNLVLDRQVLHDIKTSLSTCKWIDTVRRWDIASESNMNRMALLLLFNLATALLPTSVINPLQIGSAEAYSYDRHSPDDEDIRELLQTLRVLSNHSIKFVSNAESRERSLDLLRRVEEGEVSRTI